MLNPAPPDDPFAVHGMRDDWGRFETEVRAPSRDLLARLDTLADPLLVGGCQRSGTRIVAELIARSGGLNHCGDAPDPELRAARALAGDIVLPDVGRYCLQTTYLDDRFPEYLAHENFRLVWVIRDPASVIRSMLFNWYRPGLKRLFKHSGRHEPRTTAGPIRRPAFAMSALQRACLSYNAKCRQLETLAPALSPHRLTVIDYDRLQARRQAMLRVLAERCDFTFDAASLDIIQAKPGGARRRELSRAKRHYVERVCGDAYAQARRWAVIA